MVKRIGLPRFEPTQCDPGSGNESVHITCGYLVVSEDRRSANGLDKEVRLPVVHLCPNKTTDERLRREHRKSPVVYVHGGPGASYVSLA